MYPTSRERKRPWLNRGVRSAFEHCLNTLEEWENRNARGGENAIEHGIGDRAAGRRLEISVQMGRSVILLKAGDPPLPIGEIPSRVEIPIVGACRTAMPGSLLKLSDGIYTLTPPHQRRH